MAVIFPEALHQEWCLNLDRRQVELKVIVATVEDWLLLTLEGTRVEAPPRRKLEQLSRYDDTRA